MVDQILFFMSPMSPTVFSQIFAMPQSISPPKLGPPANIITKPKSFSMLSCKVKFSTQAPLMKRLL